LLKKRSDEIAFAVERVVTCPLHFAVALWRDYRGDFVLGESLDQRIGVVGLIGEQGAWIGAVDQRLRAGQIVRLPRRKHQFDRIAQGIDQGMDFGGQSAAGSADRLPPFFFARRRYADARARWWRRSSCIRCRDHSPTA